MKQGERIVAGNEKNLWNRFFDRRKCLRKLDFLFRRSKGVDHFGAGTDFFRHPNNFIENAVLLVFNYAPIIDERPNAQTMVLALPTLIQ